MSESRAFTEREVLDSLMDSLVAIPGYWANVSNMGVEEKLSGAVFNVLSILDGDTIPIPGFNLVACPHQDDKQYCISQGENWIEPGLVISTALHEHFSKRRAGNLNLKQLSDQVVEAARELLVNLEDSGEAYVDEDSLFADGAEEDAHDVDDYPVCLLYTSPSPRD